MLMGGCFCGGVRYEIAAGAPFNATICHCQDCRRVAGAPLVAWFTVRPSDFTFTKGTPHRFASSAGVARGFCGDCGSPLTYQRADLPDEIDITTATLDRPDAVPPEDQTFARHRLRWIETLETLPLHQDARPPSDP